MITTLRTDSSSRVFQELVELLDAELADRDGDDHAFYHQFNSIDSIKHVMVLSQDDVAIACGALKHFDHSKIEVKRMYVRPKYRGYGHASKVLKELERWAAELGYESCVLETGYQQPEALKLYKKHGYQVTDNYGQYKGVDNSVCFTKKVKS